MSKNKKGFLSGINKYLKIALIWLLPFGVVLFALWYFRKPLIKFFKNLINRVSTTVQSVASGGTADAVGSAQFDDDGRSLAEKNNNTGNIRSSTETWRGQTGDYKGFKTFKDAVHGVRAHLKLLQNYIKNKNLDTVTLILRTWAPTGDGNNPDNYAKIIEDKTGIDKNQVISKDDKVSLISIAYEMHKVEAGKYWCDKSVFVEAWDLI